MIKNIFLVSSVCHLSYQTNSTVWYDILFQANPISKTTHDKTVSTDNTSMEKAL